MRQMLSERKWARVPWLLQRWVAADCRVGSRAALVVVNNAILDGAERGLCGDARLIGSARILPGMSEQGGAGEAMLDASGRMPAVVHG